MIRSERPVCPQCHKPMRSVIVEGKHDRKFQCLDCEGEDPLYAPKIARLLAGELRPEE